jgi:hypothetical protein
MVMHRYGLARGRHADFKDPNKFVFKDDSMSGRSGLNSIVAVREFGFALPVEIEMPPEKNKNTNCQGSQNVTLSEVP